MSKAVLISIRPKWVEKIANGEKTIEVRKTKPKLNMPFKCYIYCSGGRDKLWVRDVVWRERWMNGPIAFLSNAKDCGGMNLGNGKVIGEFTCDQFWIGTPHNTNPLFCMAACMDGFDTEKYAKGKTLYGWHISDLLIYEQPRELSEFTGLHNTRFGAAPYDIKRAPQSWCYVEAMKDE